MEDFYQVLGVEPDAMPEAIQERFRFLAQAFHPDKYSSAKQKQLAEEEFKKINNAYQILSNPRKRADYDLYRHKSANHSRTNPSDVNKKAEEAERQRTQEEQRKKAEKAQPQHAYQEPRKNTKETARQLTQEELNGLIKIKPVNLRGLSLKRLDLSKTDLSEADLHEAFLNEADLCNANLTNANLGGADLSGAIYTKKTIWPEGFDLRKSGATLKISVSEQELDQILHAKTKNMRSLYLRYASLHGADLSHGNLSKAFLHAADLSAANLSQADLWDANLRDANLRGADLRSTNLGAANLRGAIFDQSTKWPDGFDPIAAGAIIEE